ncbi:MAG: exodeoxyribonuclease V subunit gamma [Gammaproteobacteria bacterium]|nr:exodeoxyribonuclease V subunit gamma [Gammaproteobacteria bacterium]
MVQIEERWGLPEVEQHSWLAGLERMVLGYALPGGEQHLFAGLLPYDEIEGEAAQLLGSLAKLMRQLVALKSELAEVLVVDEWQLRLRQLLEDFFVIDDDNEQNAHALSEALAQLSSSAADVQFEQAVSLAVVRRFLLSELERNQRAAGFISGQVTFCSMVPMRSIPARVICLLGMNDDDYPRRNTPLSFDLMSKEFRRGDRSRRDDDRYLFLESLISARDVFYLSYVGQDIRQNTPRPPSVLINELLDYVQHGFVVGEGINVVSHLVTKHPLQPFSPRYFSQQEKLFSYAAEMLLDLQQAAESEMAFFAAPLAELGDEWSQLAWPQLVSFFRHPVRFLCRHRLGIQLELSLAEGDDREPFDLDPLQQYQLRERMLSQRQAGADEAQVQALQMAASNLPHGLSGELAFEHSFERVESFYQNLKEWRLAELEPLEVNLEVNGVGLTGWLSGVTEGGLQRYFVGKLSGKRLLESWIQHLILNLVAGSGQCRVSHIVCEDREVIFPALSDAKVQLETLLELFAGGLRMPLNLFPNLAFHYMETMLAEQEKEKNGKKSKSADEVLQVSRNKWVDEWQAPSEASDVYHLLVFKKFNPINTEFQGLAERVFQPIFAVAEFT